MATNLVKHAGRGHILVQRLDAREDSGLRIISVDKGPGIADVSGLSDGHSTAGSMGTGLGAIRRLADAFEIYSLPGGNGDLCRFPAESHGSAAESARSGVVSEPIPGEDVCGDGWGMRALADGTMFMVVDGLGHGTRLRKRLAKQRGSLRGRLR